MEQAEKNLYEIDKARSHFERLHLQLDQKLRQKAATQDPTMALKGSVEENKKIPTNENEYPRSILCTCKVMKEFCVHTLEDRKHYVPNVTLLMKMYGDANLKVE
jgi:hypothetical protein